MLRRTLAVLALVLYAQVGAAQTLNSAMPSLQGLRSLGVGILIDHGEAAVPYIDTAGLRVKVELDLRRAGVLVTTPAPALLVVHITVLTLDNGHAYSYDLRLLEPATLMRSPAAGASWVSTWEQGGVGTSPPSGLSELVAKGVQELVESFLNDYLAANPPTPR